MRTPNTVTRTNQPHRKQSNVRVCTEYTQNPTATLTKHRLGARDHGASRGAGSLDSYHISEGTETRKMQIEQGNKSTYSGFARHGETRRPSKQGPAVILLVELP
jgi:hypothetical protein